MPYRDAFKKAGCTSAKDVDWADVGKKTLLTIPPMQVTAFERQITTKKLTAFDVALQVDDAKHAMRIHVAGADGGFDLDWIDRAAATPQKAALDDKTKKTSEDINVKTAMPRMKKQLIEWQNDFDATGDKLKAIVKALKAFKAGDLAKVEALATAKGGVPPADLPQQLDGLVAALGTFEADAKKLWAAADKVYLAGPRDGADGFLKKIGVKVSDVDPGELDEARKALFTISEQCNAMRAIVDTGIVGSCKALRARVANLRSMSSKNTQQATQDIRDTLKKEVDDLEKRIGSFVSGYKVEAKQGQLKRLKSPNWKNDPALNQKRFLQDFKKANAGVLGNFDRHTDDVEKTVRRLERSVPKDFLHDVAIGALLGKTRTLQKQLVDEIKTAQAVIDQHEAACDAALKQL